MRSVEEIDAEIARLTRLRATVERSTQFDVLASREAIGNRVAEVRESHGLSQTSFAASVGTYQMMLSRIEAGTRDLKAYEALAIAQTYGVSLNWLISGAETLGGGGS